MFLKQRKSVESAAWHSKENCHKKVEKLYDDAEHIVQSLSGTHEATMRTAKAFAKADVISNNTTKMLSKILRAFDQLPDKKWDIADTVNTLTDIGESLDINSIAKEHWIATCQQSKRHTRVISTKGFTF